MITTWGYTITDADALVPMLSEDDFDTITANKFAGDMRIEPSIEAASMAVRNYCGWHVYPVLACSFSERLLAGNGRIKRTGTDILIQLPAAFVSAVSSVVIDGETSEDFAFETNGLVRIFDVYEHEVTRKTVITVAYTAGIPSGLMSGIGDLIASRTTRALSGTNGIASETAGGVSISYSSSWANGGGAGALQSADSEILEPYKVRGVF